MLNKFRFRGLRGGSVFSGTVLAVFLLLLEGNTPLAKTTPAGFGSINGSPTLVKGKVVEIHAPATFVPGKDYSISLASENSKASYNVTAATLVKGKVTEVKTKKLKAGQVWALTAPVGVSLLSFFLDGKKPAGTVISQPTDNANYDFPTCPTQVVSGGITDLTGTRFSPNIDGNQVSFGNQSGDVLASSPTSIKVRVPELTPGQPVDVKVTSDGKEQKLGTTTPISLEAEVGQEVILKGQTTQITATIKGSTDVYALECNNLSTDRIDIVGQADQTVVYTSGGEDNSATLTIRGKQDGDYQVTIVPVAVVSDPTSVQLAGGCTECWEAYSACVNKVAAEEKDCYDNCDKTKGDTGCYLACSAEARLKEAECMAAYIGCMRKKILGI